MIGRKDDPAFLYFPTNYRWSMGLLICLSAAPWTGVEIDEVHRVGRALEDHVGDDDAWFEEWTRMGDKDRGARPRRGDARATRSPRRPASCAPAATTRPASASSIRGPQRSMDVYAKSVKIFAGRRRRHPPPAHRAGRGAVRRQRACRRCSCIPIRPRPARKPAPCMVFFDGFDVTKEMQYGYGIPDLAARGIGCLIVDGPGNGESVRFRNLPLIAETEQLRHRRPTSISPRAASSIPSASA